jgi:hypothetical protein
MQVVSLRQPVMAAALVGGGTWEEIYPSVSFPQVSIPKCDLGSQLEHLQLVVTIWLLVHKAFLVRWLSLSGYSTLYKMPIDLGVLHMTLGHSILARLVSCMFTGLWTANYTKVEKGIYRTFGVREGCSFWRRLIANLLLFFGGQMPVYIMVMAVMRSPLSSCLIVTSIVTGLSPILSWVYAEKWEPVFARKFRVKYARCAAH